MASKTTLNKLRSYVDKIEGENPNNHPFPKLPNSEELEGSYLQRIQDSTPWLVDEALNLVIEVGEHRGEEYIEI